MNNWTIFFQLESITFNQPEWLWGVMIWPVFWIIHHLYNHFLNETPDDISQLKNQSYPIIKHPIIAQVPPRVLSTPRSHTSFSWSSLGVQLLRGSILISLVIALAQPQKLTQSPPPPPQQTVRDIVFVIESSASLLLPDYQINGQPESRMHVIKTVLDQFIHQLDGNRFSLIIYADQAYTLMPLTYDQATARSFLNRLTPHLAGRLDTAMGEALGLALKQTESALKDNTPPLKRIIVLISDGLSQPSTLPLSEAIVYAQQIQVPIYTIGVGASSQKADQRTYTGLLYQPLESQSLTQLAHNTSAQYFQIQSGDELNQILHTIDQTEGVPFAPPSSTPVYTPLYYLPLGLSSALFLLYLILILIRLFRSPKESRT